MRWTIGKKLTSVFALTLIILGFMGGLSIYKLYKFNQKVDELVNDWRPRLEAILQIDTGSDRPDCGCDPNDGGWHTKRLGCRRGAAGCHAGNRRIGYDLVRNGGGAARHDRAIPRIEPKKALPCPSGMEVLFC